MSREKKVRIWNLHEKKMIGPKDAIIEPDMHGVQGYSEHYGSDDHTSHPVMLYTGLKDKNREEIYEGDIVRFDNHSTDRYGKYELKHNFHVVKYEGQSFYPRPLTSRDAVVVGTVHENPELLEDS